MSAGLALFSPLLLSESFREIESGLDSGIRGRTVAGLVEGARALVATLLAERLRRPILLVVPDDAALEAWRRDLAAVAVLLGRDPKRIRAFPALDADPYDGIPPHPETSRERVVALTRLAGRDVSILLTPARAWLQRLPAPDEIRARVLDVRPGSTLAPDRFVLEAMRAGYRRVDVVSGPCEVSRRGGIVDVFPPDADEPVRIELFGETVESLRTFDTDHQRSTGALDRVTIGPAVENVADDPSMERLAAWLDAGARRAKEEDGPTLKFRERLDVLRSEGYFPGIEALAGIMARRSVSLAEHAPGMVLAVDDPGRTEEALARAAHELDASWRASGERVLPSPDRLFFDAVEARDAIRRFDLGFEELRGAEPDGGGGTVEIPSRSARAWSGRFADLAAALREDGAHGIRTVCVMRAPGSAERLAEILSEYRLHPALRTQASDPTETIPAAGGLFIRVAGLRNGFELPAHALNILAERDVYGEEAKGPERKSRSRAAFISDFRDLRLGDVVVHVDHGIAKYVGLGRPKGGSLNRDFMILEFAGGDRLFVPMDRLDLVQRYAGVGGSKPALDKLGGPGWERVKSRVRKSVESMAKELLELYARRRAARGTAFSPDTAWQRELEASFPYDLTPDQERAVREVKEDMESERPMDRLLVGDVGFGKTEVAVRAAFKAIQDGYQVAILAPTTVLAAQHHNVIRERFAPFPVKVEMVSRFRSPEENRRVLRSLAVGEIDLVIGTHRLLSKDVQFRRLGLLVVDEEQRFGVAHKERLKKLTLGVDSLAMTATPIPRTLQMSLAGVRDLSIIETPPPGRSAIQTYLVPFKRNVVAQAIRQEVRREGQVFVVHHRVETIPALVRALQESVPEARFAVAHGQMNEHALEKVMLRFVRREADVLVTTTLIENGLDIPRANTIVVNRADRFGLGQLYQLRGRVGRSEQHAYAYFIVPGRHVLTDTARRRLKALQEFSELGSGFRLAAADLEIRGAGEFLGKRQHGHIAALGFDLFCQMLERAVAEQSGSPVVERPPATFHLGIDIKVPETFMPEVGDRLALYKRLSAAREIADVDRLQADAEDRFGHLPPAGSNLFALSRLRIVAEAAGVKSVDVVEDRLQIRFQETASVDPTRVVRIIEARRGAITPSGMLVLPAPEKASERIEAIRSLIERIREGTTG